MTPQSLTRIPPFLLSNQFSSLGLSLIDSSFRPRRPMIVTLDVVQRIITTWSHVNRHFTLTVVIRSGVAWQHLDWI